MDREIEHILSENYPNPPPPGFRYPPLPRIIQLNENEIKTEYCYSDEHLSFKTVTNMESEEDEFHDTLSISIDESMEISPAVEEYVKTTTVSNNVLEDIIEEKVEHDFQKTVTSKILEDIVEERVEHNVQKAESNKILEERVEHDLQKAESIKILEDIVEERVEHDLQKAKKTESIETETKNVKDILNINIVDNSLLIVNETNLNQVDQMNKHQFLKYPHSPPFGLYHMCLPKIASCYSKEDVNVENHNRAEQNCDEKEQITSQLESIILNKPDVSEPSSNKQQTKNENHSIIEKKVINSQPKTTDKDQQMNKLYKKTDEVVGKERVEQRIQTTICCCIKI